LEVYRGEEKAADDTNEGATNPTEEMQEIDLILEAQTASFWRLSRAHDLVEERRLDFVQRTPPPA
jgi:hypothetical protein